MYRGSLGRAGMGLPGRAGEQEGEALGKCRTGYAAWP